jgi:hypothetical protein
MAHRERPTIKTTRKRIETSSVSFVFRAFLIWGEVLATENAVAKSPMIVNKISENQFWYEFGLVIYLLLNPRAHVKLVTSPLGPYLTTI